MKSSSKKFCPFPDCQNIVEKNPHTKKTWCFKCNNTFCFKCQLPWHEGQTCHQALIQVQKSWAFKVGAHKCPQCKTPIEKSQGCVHMTCTMCNHSYCWVCGLPQDHWLHKIPFKPFQCIKAPDTTLSMIFVLFLFIVVLLTLPILLLIYLLCQAGYYGIYPLFSIADRANACNNCLCSLMLGPLFMLYLPLVIAFGFVAAAVGTVILIGPAYYVHIFSFNKIMRWWNANRSHEQTPTPQKYVASPILEV